MAEKRLYLVEINYDDFEYDAFVSGVVWAENSQQAKEVMRNAKDDEGKSVVLGCQKAGLTARLAKKSGVVHTHWHAG